ncbi:MAG: methyltransferase domain-containing protein [Synechococcales cyanobacterium CRU_2_2]|nr:methyltransferase domain-containing protein [Synechococcales cyanobacterium CRU_2_2]
MNILFVLYHDFSSNSAVHVHHFANGLIELGMDCVVAVPRHLETISILSSPRYQILEFSQIEQIPHKFVNGKEPDLVHCWTPRENIRIFCENLRQLYDFKLVIHLEDNEEHILEKFLGRPFVDLAQEQDLEVSETLSHPRNYRTFLESASGATIIIEKLREFVPCSIPSVVLWPGSDGELFFPQEADAKLRKELRIRSKDIVLCYTGNVHPVNAHEVRSLYLAIGLLNREGYPTKLIRTGHDFCDFLEDGKTWLDSYCIELGYVERTQLSKLLSLADILVQPGKVDPFNEYRFPSKLPEFLAMGKPVILPKTNIGCVLTHLENAIVLEKVDSLNILEHVKLLHGDVCLSQKISDGAIRFTHEYLSWSHQCKMLKSFYESFFQKIEKSTNKIKEKIAMQPVVLLNQHTRDLLLDRYVNASEHRQRLGYATVRDFCDSAENLPQVCFLNGDLKNVQRAWTVKALLSNVPIGSKLLEIGGGIPLVAGLLSELGYDVTLIDPYEGTGNGPTSEYDQYVTQFPHVKIIKDLFSSQIDYFDAGSFDAVYSISVIEHIPLHSISDVFHAISMFLKKGGASIHCIDDVIQGNGTEGHEEMVKHVLKHQKHLSDQRYSDTQLENDYENLMFLLKEDLETFYLSPLGHNLWRGKMAYEDFPFRKVVSIQTCEFLA